ncbi:MAG: hypothetical protein ABW166_12175 [Sedimenticola sp.]
MTDDVIIREPEYLSWPPDGTNRYGYLAVHWPNNKIPVSENDAIVQAMTINKDLFNTLTNKTVYRHNPALPTYQIPKFENGAGPDLRTTRSLSNRQITVDSWLKNNWKWLVPVAIGTALLISRR